MLGFGFGFRFLGVMSISFFFFLGSGLVVEVCYRGFWALGSGFTNQTESDA